MSWWEARSPPSNQCSLTLKSKSSQHAVCNVHPTKKWLCVCMCKFSWAEPPRYTRSDTVYRQADSIPKNTHSVGHKLARGCISLAWRKRGLTGGQREAKVHLKSSPLWGFLGKNLTGYPEDTHFCPMSTCQSKQSRTPSPRRSSLNSKGIKSRLFLHKQTTVSSENSFVLFFIFPVVVSPWKDKWWRKEVRRWRRLEGFGKSP